VLAAALATVACAYLLGSIPTGFLVGRARGVDLRAVGSGNIGATNALRILGKPAGIFVLVVDALKGWLGCTLVPHVTSRWFPIPPALQASSALWLPILGGMAAVLGHNFTCWLRFRGGKGIATSAGVAMGIFALPFFIAAAVFLIGLACTRIVSLSCLVAAAVLPFATWFITSQPVLLAFSIALAALAFARHRANIRRLLAGTEPRLGQKAPPPASPAS
jgi:glycerol-3-phosphate acyltransferase PlsY